MNDGLINMVRNIHAVGRNYAAHIEELGNERPAEPVVFSKVPACLTSANLLHFPMSMAPVHYELELVLRIGRHYECGAKPKSFKVSHMALGLDFTARDCQTRQKEKGLPWHPAKNFRDACFLGPLTTDFHLTEPFLFQLYVNGNLAQDGDSGKMIYDFHTILTYLNTTMPLMEGDLIYTGTPAGVGPVNEGDRLRLVCDALQTDLEILASFV